MSFIESLEEARQLNEYLYQEGVALYNRCQDGTPRGEIVEWIKTCIANAELVLRSGQGSRTEISNAIKDGLLYPTSFASIMATSAEIRDKFEHYIDAGRIFDTIRLSARKGLTTDYLVKKSVSAGEIDRIDDFGSAIGLYVA